MDDVVKMYAMSDGNPDIEPAESSADHDDFEDEGVETSNVITSSDDDEGVVEESVVVAVAAPVRAPAPKRALKKASVKKAAPKKAAAKK